MLQLHDIVAGDTRYQVAVGGDVTLKKNTGRPDAVSRTSPSVNCMLRLGRVAISPGPGFRLDGAMETGWGKPKRAVPRVMISVLSTRSSIGTKIGDGSGGAVRAAASAGDSIRLPANQPRTAMHTTTAKAPTNTAIRLPAILESAPGRCVMRALDVPALFQVATRPDLRHPPIRLLSSASGVLAMSVHAVESS
ncbi:MAG: hypothetical protein N838_11385 [Thiohalocapsa sp. PB-PSB1]|nr:MAG: hypothetical protein N838_11385 [Thiohalocapsa sp. PB-PSB1]